MLEVDIKVVVSAPSRDVHSIILKIFETGERFYFAANTIINRLHRRWYQIKCDKNIFKILIITVLVLGYFLPTCFAQNVESSDTVSALKETVGPEMSIYENPNNNFKLSYPQDWYAREPDPNSIGIVYGFLPPEEDIINPMDYVIIQVELLPLQTTLDQYTQSLIRQIKNDSANVKIISAKTATMGINPAGELVYTLQGKGNSFKILKIFTVIDNKAYIITYNALIDNYDRLRGDVRNIVGSFAFTGTLKQEQMPVHLMARNEAGPKKEPIVGPTVIGEEMSEEQIVSHRTDEVEENLRALKDKNSSVKAEAAKALGGFNDARAIDPLIQAIRDTDSDVRFEAERASELWEALP